MTAARGGVGRTLCTANLVRRLAESCAVLAVDATGTGALGWWLGVDPRPWSELEVVSRAATRARRARRHERRASAVSGRWGSDRAVSRHARRDHHGSTLARGHRRHRRSAPGGRAGSNVCGAQRSGPCAVVRRSGVGGRPRGGGRARVGLADRLAGRDRGCVPRVAPRRTGDRRDAGSPRPRLGRAWQGVRRLADLLAIDAT